MRAARAGSALASALADEVRAHAACRASNWPLVAPLRTRVAAVAMGRREGRRAPIDGFKVKERAGGRHRYGQVWTPVARRCQGRRALIVGFRMKAALSGRIGAPSAGAAGAAFDSRAARWRRGSTMHSRNGAAARCEGCGGAHSAGGRDDQRESAAEASGSGSGRPCGALPARARYTLASPPDARWTASVQHVPINPNAVLAGLRDNEGQDSARSPTRKT